MAPLGLDSEQRGWYVRAVALGSELPPVDLLETAIRSFFVDLDNERFEALATGLARDAQLADEISGNWLLGEERVAGYLCAHQGMVTELVSELSGVRARWMAPAVGVVSFMLEQTYRFGDVRRHEKMTGSAIFVIEQKELRLAMLHLGATSQSMSPVDYDRTVLPGEFKEDRPGAGETAEAVGPTMRRLRSQAKKSLRELARDAGVSPGFLSQLERGLADPSLATLQKIATALDLPITALFEQDVPAPSFVLRASQRRETTFPDSGVTYESLSPACDRVLDVWIGSIPPGKTSSSGPTRHDGEEHILVLSGELQLDCNGETVALSPGDAAYLASGTPHRLAATSPTPARFLSSLVASPSQNPYRSHPLKRASGSPVAEITSAIPEHTPAEPNRREEEMQ